MTDTDRTFRDMGDDTLNVVADGSTVDLRPRTPRGDASGLLCFYPGTAREVAAAILAAADELDPPKVEAPAAPSRPQVGDKVRVKRGAVYAFGGVNYPSSGAARYVGEVVTVADPSVLVDPRNVRVRTANGDFFAVLPEFVEPVEERGTDVEAPAPMTKEEAVTAAVGILGDSPRAPDVIALVNFLMEA